MPAARIPSSGRAQIAGAGILTAVIAAGDLLLEQPAYGTLIVVPFIVAAGAGRRMTAAAGATALAIALALGARHGFLGLGHVARLAMIAIGSVIAVVFAHFRQRRDAELTETRARAIADERTRLALDAGGMGTWRWDVASGHVEWDERLEALFGKAPGTFEGTFAAWTSALHPDDRDRVLATIDAALERRRSFQFDHRIVWPDGSVHWLEGRGEPLVDRTGRVTGAAGVAIGIDLRRRAEEERTRLLAAEREARDAAERSNEALARLGELTMALAAAGTVDEVAAAMVRSGMEALHAEYGWFGLADPDAGAMVTRAFAGYDRPHVERYGPIPLDSAIPAAVVLRSGRPVFVTSPEDCRRRFPDYPPAEAHPAFVTVPIDAAPGVRGTLAFGFREPRTFSDADRRYTAAVVEACAQALRRAAVAEAERAGRERLRTVLDASEALARLDEPSLVVATLVRIAAQRVGQFASIYLSKPEGGFRLAAMAHANAAIEPVMHDLVHRGIDAAEMLAKVFARGEATVIRNPPHPDTFESETDRLVARLHATALVVAPLRIGDRLLGVLLIGDDRPVAFGAQELEIAIDLARRGASALERTELWQAHVRQYETEHRIVEMLQRSIMPERLPEVPGVEIGAVYRPADVSVDVGGDWYDAFRVGRRIVLAVGDVAGHGVEAAGLMGRVRNAMRAFAVEDDDPALLLQRVDAMLLALEDESMVTAIAAVFDPETRVLTWARAGHPPPLVCEPDGRTRFLDDVRGVPLGTLSRGYTAARLELTPGALLVCYTDGLVERRDAAFDDGLDWLASRVRDQRDRPVSELCALLAEQPFVAPPAPDDICVLALRARGHGPGAGATRR